MFGTLGRVILMAAVTAAASPGCALAAQRTFVSTSGSDVNACFRPEPCRSFDAAIAQTDPGGEVVVLDSGGYGPATVSQSVSLVAPPGVHAAITAFSGNAVSVNAGAMDVVVIRGLSLSGLGLGTRGIQFTAGAALHVESTTVSEFTAAGILVSAPGAHVYVSDAVSRQNFEGFRFQSAGATVRATLSAVRAEGNSGPGIAAYGGSVVVVDRTVSGGSTSGAGYFSTDSAEMSIAGSTAAHAFQGIFVSQGGTVRVSASVITGNGIGLAAGTGGGSLISFGNNRLAGNGTDGAFTDTIALE